MHDSACYDRKTGVLRALLCDGAHDLVNSSHHCSQSSGCRYLDKAGLRQTKAFVANGICIFVLWIFSRLLLLMYAFAHMWVHRSALWTTEPYVQVKHHRRLNFLMFA